jgi:hypothetical protein
MPSEIAAAVILCAVAETKVFNFSDALSAVEIPVDKVSRAFLSPKVSYVLV